MIVMDSKKEGGERKSQVTPCDLLDLVIMSFNDLSVKLNKS